MITLEDGNFGWDFILRHAPSGRTVLIQTDWDYPGVASCFGWVACQCGETDGTVACAHRDVLEMISSAHDWLTEHVGESVEDPGYFAEAV